jgi:TRAP-type uncharacterized transport system fused permease subunit
LPAFVTPFLFVLAPQGVGLLLASDAITVILVTTLAVVCVLALAVAAQGWLRGPLNIAERVALIAAGLLIAVSSAWSAAAGLALGIFAVILHFARTRRSAA